MLDYIAIIVGYTLIIAVGLAGIGIALYFCYDYYIKRLLNWNESEARAEIVYFLHHKKEIQEYIKNKQVKS